MADLSHLATPGAILTLRVTPNARSTDLALRDGVIHIRVTVVPEKGKANAAVLAALSKALGLPKSRLTLLTGSTGRNKRVQII